ncbi:MAG: hypothetical protein AB1657_05865 [Candidatus Micrarchaeota archaeon]
MEKQFNAQYIDEEFGKIGARIRKPVSIYLIGGCAMSFRGLKETTRDVDIVFKDKSDCKIFCEALFGAQYYEPITIKTEHEHLHAIKMYENKDGFHLDLFIKQVIRKLMLSESMVARAKFYKKYGGLSVYLLSKEDIFLFKGLASEGRERDLPDMQVLYPNLDWKMILEELKSQHLSGDLRELFARRLAAFNQKYRLDVPILKDLKGKL